MSETKSVTHSQPDESPLYSLDANVDWNSRTTHVILNPRLPSEQKKQIYQTLNNNCFIGKSGARCLPEASIVLQTSGSTTPISPSGKPALTKLVVISKAAFFASALAVNEHFCITPEDKWLQVLPRFHVGGLSIYARALLSKSQVIESSLIENKWDTNIFLKELISSQATLVSLVPTQIFDLCSQKLSPPESLRVIVVGGAKLNASLYQRARRLGWPIYPSFGATELCSQIATAPYSATPSSPKRGPNEAQIADHSTELLNANTNDDLALPELQMPRFDLLSHIECQVDPTGRLMFRGPSLFSGYIFVQDNPEWGEAKDSAGWFVSEDFGSLDGKSLSLAGRGADYIKIGGEAISLVELNEILEMARDRTNFIYDCTLLALPDDRLGEAIYLALASPSELGRSGTQVELARSESQATLGTAPNDLACTTQVSLESLITFYNSNVLPMAKIREVICVDQLPRSPLGKILRDDLKTLCLEKRGSSST